MSDLLVVESNERLVDPGEVVDALVVYELEQVSSTELELQELLATEIELLETQSTFSEVLEIDGEQVVLEVGMQGPVGPAGPSGGEPPMSPSLSYADGKLVGVVYADGSTKVLSYAQERLAQVDFLRVGQPGIRKILSYNPDGTLAAVVQSAI